MEQNNRQEYIGSTEVASIIGVSPYENAYDVWCSKKLKHEKIFDPGTLERMRWGLLLEKLINYCTYSTVPTLISTLE